MGGAVRTFKRGGLRLLEENQLEVLESRSASVGSFQVRRTLPQRRRRTVGAWCFADHMGPADVTEGSGLNIGPHPHAGLRTVTWLIEGQALHRDSLGNEQVISAGQLNLMTAGFGVSHAEEATGHYHGTLQGIQLWIAQDDGHRDGGADFEHHAAPPRVELAAGIATVLLGQLHGTRSLVRHGPNLLGAELSLQGISEVALKTSFEYGIIVLKGLVDVDRQPLGPGALAYHAPGRDVLEVNAREPSIVILLGGVPLEHQIFMWWNFVARTRGEIESACDSWRTNDGRFGKVDSPLARVESGEPYWRTRAM